MKNSLFKGRATRTKVFTLITVGVIIAVLGINYLLTYLFGSNGLQIDLTAEELYTLSPEMKEECAFVDTLDDGDEALTITFCSDPDTLIESTVTRVVYFMALDLEREFDNIEVETVNVRYNPTAVASFRTTSLAEINPVDVIVSYRGSYRIMSAEQFWTVTSENTYFSFNGEYRMATLIKSVTAVNKPVAYFTVGHGETYYDADKPESAMSVEASAIYDLLVNRGFEVRTLDLSKSEIPDDCALIIINNPTEDFVFDGDKLDSFFYYSETDKLDVYLRTDQGALMVTKAPEVELPNLDNFLYEWGFEFSDAVVSDPKNNVGTPSKVLGVYETNTDSYANAIYGEFASLPSAPHTVFGNTGYINCSFYETHVKTEDGAGNVFLNYESFMTSYDTAVATKDGLTVAQDTELDLASVVVRSALDSFTNERAFSYVFCSNSADFLGRELLSDRAYANYDIVSAVINNISRTDEYASIKLGGLSANSPKYGGKQLIYDTLSETMNEIYNPDATVKGHTKAFSSGVRTVIATISIVVPLIPLLTGVAIKLRRKFL